MIDIVKNANLEKTEFAVYEKLVEKEPIRPSHYPIHKVFYACAEYLLGCPYGKRCFGYELAGVMNVLS